MIIEYTVSTSTVPGVKKVEKFMLQFFKVEFSTCLFLNSDFF